MTAFEDLGQTLRRIPLAHRFGRVETVGTVFVDVIGLGDQVRLGDQVALDRRDGGPIRGEIIALGPRHARIMTYVDCAGLGTRQPARLEPDQPILPCAGWQGRIVDAFGAPLDGGQLPPGERDMPIRAFAPPAAHRRSIGRRMHTGVAALDTMLPLARGQRIGIFAGSGVGKSTLLADIARGARADRVVLALIGERGRELRHFTHEVLGDEGLSRSVVVAATADQSALVKRRAAWTAMAVAEYFRDQGEHVLLLVDSLTRMAEAHREVALTAGEAASLRAFPPSTSGLISGLAERAGPGLEGQGDITAVFSVLVAGSDMDEPVSDIARGVLDGHVVLDREIAERGRFPAIDVRRSVSRSLPGVASEEENALILRARRVLGTYESAAPMIQAGLYTRGTDAAIDQAVEVWPRLDAFFARTGVPDEATAFAALSACFDPAAN
ncbi:FliI/YscN family ATPase [Oceanibium sediminis]|uniref:FliI/YscN family ATPase n=1 Tax=Oceanibium sediminis TaxID=2026339 RepID=UPI000DD3C9B4|nr:FliI/YscN family ATPase [Oceanibium sediminis]